MAFTVVLVLLTLTCTSTQAYFFNFLFGKSYFAWRVIEAREKVREICPQYEVKYNTTVNESTECFSSDKGSHSLCSFAKANIDRCSKPVRDFAVECLPENSKEIPHIIYKGIVSTIDTFCASTGESLLELLNPCLWKIKEEPESEGCLQDLGTRFEKFSTELPTKTSLCKFGEVLETCWKVPINKHCKNPVVKEISYQFYHAIFSGCEGSQNTILQN